MLVDDSGNVVYLSFDFIFFRGRTKGGDTADRGPVRGKFATGGEGYPGRTVRCHYRVGYRQVGILHDCMPAACSNRHSNIFYRAISSKRGAGVLLFRARDRFTRSGNPVLIL